MKKYIVLIAIVLVIAAGVFFAKSHFAPPHKTEEITTVNLSDLFFVQYCIYAPESAEVSLDGKALTYNKNIDCFSTEVKKEGDYTLRIVQEGCEAIEETVYISTQSREYTPTFKYTDDFMKDGQTAGKELLEAIMQKCWSLSYDLSEFNFTDKDAQISCEEKAADLVSALEKNISAGYTVGKLNLTLTSNSSPSKAPDSDGSSVLAGFEAEYSYDWEFSGDAYNDSGKTQRKSKPFIIIESRDGEWYIRDFYLFLDNGIM